jgi:hypothetical protein
VNVPCGAWRNIFGTACLPDLLQSLANVHNPPRFWRFYFPPGGRLDAASH